MMRVQFASRPVTAWLLGLMLVAAACTAAAPADTTPAAEPAVKLPSTTALPSPSTTIEPPTTTTSTTTTTTTTEPPRFWDDIERVNIMLLGSDAGVGRIGTRTDTIIVVSIAPASGDAAMFSVPRNLTEAPLPEGLGVWSCNCFPDIITHLWANGEWYPDAFPGPQEPSVNALKGALGLIFGIDIQYYAKVELAGFVAMVDALGGVTIDVPKRIVDPSYPHEDGGTESMVIEQGSQHLDGHQALAYGRIRHNSGDFARMHRQRCLVGSILRDTDVSDLIAGGPELVAAVGEHIEMDIPFEALDDLVVLLSRLDVERLATLRITSHKYGTTGHAGYQIYDLDRIRNDAAALMADPTTQLDSQDGAGLDDTCTQSFD